MPAQIVEATLVRRYVREVCPGCGLSLRELKDDVQLGKVYKVDLSQRQVKTFINTEHGVKWSCESVPEVGTDPVEWMPTEMLMRNGMAL